MVHVWAPGEPEVSSLGPGGCAGGGPGSVTSGGPSEAHAGPRIFVGKLTKGTTEDDVKQYFTRCACGACSACVSAYMIAAQTRLNSISGVLAVPEAT